MRDRNLTPHPDEARDLAALDAALAGEPTELSALVRDVRVAAPTLTLAGTARLDALVEAGLEHEPAGARQRAGRAAGRHLARASGAMSPGWPQWLTSRTLAFAGGGTLAAALVAVVVLAGSGAGNDGPSSGSPAGGARAQSDVSTLGEPLRRPADTAKPAAAPAESGAAGGSATAATPSAAAPAPTLREFSSTTRPRRVERTTQLTLTAPADKVQRAADGVVAVADRTRAIVQQSSIDLDDTGHGEATFVLRVPTAHVQEALAALSRLAHVRSRSETSLDITAPTATTADHLADARAERDSLLRRLGQATTDNQAAALRARIRDTRARILELEGDAQRLANRAGYATVNVSLLSTGKRHTTATGAKHHDGGAWGPGAAWHDTQRVLRSVAGAAILAGALGVPLLLLAAAALTGTRRARRRRREAALGAA